MKCFIVEDGVEREAGLEDLLPVIAGDRFALREILTKARSKKINLGAVIANLNDELKEMVYRNVPAWVRSELYCMCPVYEFDYDKKDVRRLMRENKEELTELIGECLRQGYISIECPKNIIWKDEEEKTLAPFETEGGSLFSALENLIEEALNSGFLGMDYPLPKGLTHEDLQNAFQNRVSELQKIRRLCIKRNYLSAAALLFETGNVEELTIYGEDDGEWPSFLENCRTLTKLTFWWFRLSEIPSWIRGASSLRELQIDITGISSLPDWLGDLQSLTKLSISCDENLTTLPDSIGNLKNLVELTIEKSSIKKLPDSMANLKNLQELYLTGSLIENIPDWIDDLQSLTHLSLLENKNLTKLPDSIGNLKELAFLDLRDSPIEKFPDTITNCTALKSVDIFGTKITSVPDFISSVKNFNDNKIIQLIPQGQSVSYTCFCNSYYRLAQTILKFSDIARHRGILALEEEIDHLAEGFFKQGIRLLVDGTDSEIIRQILTTKLEHEHDYYRKKIMQVAIEGILSIHNGDERVAVISRLASLVNIKNNPLDTAIAKYFSGNIYAINSIHFELAMIPEDEREEIRFIKRAAELSEKTRREGFLALEEHLDKEKIAARDVFEYSLPLIIDNWDYALIKKILDNLIEHETDPVQKNIAQAKIEAVMSICAGDNPRVLVMKLCAYFDESIEREIRNEK